MLPGTRECHIYIYIQDCTLWQLPKQNRKYGSAWEGTIKCTAIYIWHSPVPGNIFHSDFPFFRLSLTALNFCGNGISSKFKKPVFIHIMTTFKTPKLSPETFSMGAYRTPKVGCFFKIVKTHHFCCFITQLVKKLQQWSLYEVIEDILLFVFNTKQPLSNIWLLSYRQYIFGCFLNKNDYG